MCGRTSLFVPLDDLEDRFDAKYVADGGYQARFNIPRPKLKRKCALSANRMGHAGESERSGVVITVCKRR